MEGNNNENLEKKTIKNKKSITQKEIINVSFESDSTVMMKKWLTKKMQH